MAGIDTFGTDAYITQAEYQLSNMWYLVFEDYLTFDFSIRSMTLPFPSIEWGITSFGRVYPEGFNPNNEMTITFRENVRFTNYNFFVKWLNQIFDFDKHVYKKNFMLQTKGASIIFVRRPSFGSNVASQVAESALMQPTKVFNIRHILPASISDLSLDDEKGEPLEFTVTLKFDNMGSPFIGEKALKAVGLNTEQFSL
jgi:hypothetical protein